MEKQDILLIKLMDLDKALLEAKKLTANLIEELNENKDTSSR